MVPSRIVHPNLQLLDITDRFIESAKKIPTGELIKDEGFTLFEAVGALEIGDPKMDSGALEEGDDLEDDFDFTRQLAPEEVIWIMDELICREVSWHQGYPLSQTLFTSVHLDKILWPDPRKIEDAHFIRLAERRVLSPAEELLRAYCLGLVKCCDLVLAMVTSQHYYEEEDFATQLYNREMLRAFAIDDVTAVMQRAKKDVEDSTDLTYRTELLQRLEFRAALLRLLSQCSAGILPNGSDLPALLNEIKQSNHAGRALPEAFSIKIQHRLASSVPPRPMVTSDRNEAFAYLTQLLQDTPATFELLNVGSASDLYTAFWTFMSQSSTPCVYVRSLMQSFLTLEDKMLGRIPLHDMVVDDLAALVLPASVLLDSATSTVESPSNPRFQIASQVSQFVNKISMPFQNQFRSFALNRSRVRRNLCHAAIEWDNIQADAEEIDGYLQTLTNEKPLPYGSGDELAYAYPLSSWVYHYKLLQLRLLIQMGFELQVYAAAEYVDMYWYLGHVASLHLSHLERISYFVSQAKVLPHWALERHKTKSQNALRFLYRHFSLLKATDTLAGALHRVFVVLQRHETPNRETYSSDELRYELRMRPFQHLSVPEPLGYREMKQMSSLESVSDRELLDQASRLALTSRKAWEEVLKEKWHFEPLLEGAKTEVIASEWTRNVKNNMKACIGTSIAVTALTKAIEQRQQWKAVVPGPDDPERFHRWWAVPKISR